MPPAPASPVAAQSPPDPTLWHHGRRWLLHRPWAWAATAGTWAAGWACMQALDGHIDLANQALVLVLTATVAALWASPRVALLADTLAVLAFNWSFVPPRGAFAVDLQQHALLLATMLAVGWTVALLLARLRRQAARADEHALRSHQLRQFSDQLRAAPGPAEQAAALQALLGAGMDAGPAVAVVLPSGLCGAANDDEATGLHLCMQDGRAMGPGTGRHEEQAAWYLPLRGRHGSHGAALVRWHEEATPPPPDRLAHAQALCDQLGAELERAAAEQAAASAREQAQTQAVRNTLLAAIAHDHRTPLASILSAAGALHDQGERLSVAQRQRLAASIVDEATQLARLTDNTLQLARLEAPGMALGLDWESAEDMVGTVLRRARQRHPGLALKVRVEPGLPLLLCDAVLLVQLLDNLLDNALRHAPGSGPIELVARRMGNALLLAVRDRGPGVPLAWRERIFTVFERGAAADAPGSADGAPRRGAGMGLALCRAIAQAHGGTLQLRQRAHGGTSAELRLPLQTPPTAPEAAPCP